MARVATAHATSIANADARGSMAVLARLARVLRGRAHLVKLFNPEDPTQALSPLQCLTTALSSDYLAQQLNQSMMRNRAPDAVLTHNSLSLRKRGGLWPNGSKSLARHRRRTGRDLTVWPGVSRDQRSLADIVTEVANRAMRYCCLRIAANHRRIIASDGASQAVRVSSSGVIPSTWTSWLDGLLTEQSNEMAAQPPHLRAICRAWSTLSEEQH